MYPTRQVEYVVLRRMTAHECKATDRGNLFANVCQVDCVIVCYKF